MSITYRLENKRIIDNSAVKREIFKMNPIDLHEKILETDIEGNNFNRANQNGRSTPIYDFNNL